METLVLNDTLLSQIKENQSYQLIDTRLPDFFELGFIKNSLNISLKISKGKNLGGIISHDTPTLLFCKPETETTSIEHLQSFGLKNIEGVIALQKEQLQSINYDMVISISSEEVVLDSLHNPKALIIDVRSAENYAKGKLNGAINIPINTLSSKIQDLQKSQETIIYCTSGNTSMLACSYLKKLGFNNIKNVWGGFDAIKTEPKAIINA